jgi:hypothetical protein
VSRVKGFSDDVDHSFLGKNLCNTLHALAGAVPSLGEHHIADQSDHPDGPGAEDFYKLREDTCSHRDFRNFLIARLRVLWPTNVRVDGQDAGLHIGHAARAEVTAETVQFAACASTRMCAHVGSGKISHHLLRNAVLLALEEKAAVMKRPAAACKKRPAAAAADMLKVMKRPSVACEKRRH